jgi:hypothetical protein
MAYNSMTVIAAVVAYNIETLFPTFRPWSVVDITILNTLGLVKHYYHPTVVLKAAVL